MLCKQGHSHAPSVKFSKPVGEVRKQYLWNNFSYLYGRNQFTYFQQGNSNYNYAITWNMRSQILQYLECNAVNCPVIFL